MNKPPLLWQAVGELLFNYKKKRIMKERTVVIVNEKKMHLIVGVNPNTIENNENLWDISFEDFLTKAVEVNEDIWYVYFNGRCYETSEEV